MGNLEMIGQGATSKIYREGARALKLYQKMPFAVVEEEAKLQSFAVQAGLPVPAVYGVRVLEDGDVLLEMDYIPGRPVFYEKMDKEQRKSAILTLVTQQCEIHKISAPELPGLGDRLVWKIENNPYLAPELQAELKLLLHSLDKGMQCLCHGDLHPLNILWDGKKHWIIDWVDAAAGDPRADACRTYLIFRQYMARYAGVYLRLYCKAAGVPQEEVLDWLPVIAAARMTENMDEKSRKKLLAIVEDGMKLKKAAGGKCADKAR